MKKLKASIGLVSLLVALAACTVASPAAPTFTPTPSAPPMPTPTATSTLTLTPTPIPGVLLPASADLLLPEGVIAWRLPDAHIRQIAFSPNGNYLAVASSRVFIYRADTLELWATMPESNEVFSVAWSPNGAYLAGGSPDGRILIWDIAAKQVLTSFEISSQTIDGLTWSPDGQQLAVGAIANGGEDTILRIWDIASGEESVKLDTTGDYSHYFFVAWSPDGEQLAAGCLQCGWLELWNTLTGEKQLSLSGLPDMITWVTSVAWSPDGRWLASGLGNGDPGFQSQVVIYDPVTGETHKILSVPADPAEIRGVETDPGIYHNPWDVDAITWSPDSRMLASGSYNGMLRLWDISTGEIVASLDNVGAGKSIAWSPDGKIVAISNYEGFLIMWDVSQFP